jgi:hypothetical protein
MDTAVTHPVPLVTAHTGLARTHIAEAGRGQSLCSQNKFCTGVGSLVPGCVVIYPKKKLHTDVHALVCAYVSEKQA